MNKETRTRTITEEYTVFFGDDGTPSCGEHSGYDYTKCPHLQWIGGRWTMYGGAEVGPDDITQIMEIPECDDLPGEDKQRTEGVE